MRAPKGPSGRDDGGVRPPESPMREPDRVGAADGRVTRSVAARSSSLADDGEMRIRAALDFCATEGLRRVVLALSFHASTAQLNHLRSDPRIVGVIAAHPDEAQQQAFGPWLGSYFPEDYDWTLPARPARSIVYVGARSSLTFRMAYSALRRGVIRIACQAPLGWTWVPLWSYVARRVREKLRHRMGLTAGWLGHPAIHRVAQQLDRRTAVYRRILAAGPVWPPAANVEPGRVILVNTGLIWGGAERQVVNTLLELSRLPLPSLTLLCENLHGSPERSFYLPLLADTGVEVSEIRHLTLVAHRWPGVSGLEALLEGLGPIPKGLADDVLDLVGEFLERQPDVVHAWQDSTSIKAGIAAVLAGVPRVILSTRNVSPQHFDYYVPYMWPAYRALAERSNVVFVNNSEAGARDYAAWLGVPRSRFTVVRNGLDLSGLERVGREAVIDYRRVLGIPPDAPVVGSIFRFYKEKQPHLWVRTAAEIARRNPNVHFIVVGSGPMRAAVRRLAGRLGLIGRLHFPGTTTDIATALSAMDVFLLTSKFEGTPNVILEAQWLGVPAVTTNAGGAAEAVEHGVTGWVAERGSPRALAERVEWVLGQPTWYAAARLAGPTFVRQRFDLGRMARETLAVYGCEGLAAARSRSDRSGGSHA